jgi:hypothetical protein
MRRIGFRLPLITAWACLEYGVMSAVAQGAEPPPPPPPPAAPPAPAAGTPVVVPAQPPPQVGAPPAEVAPAPQPPAPMPPPPPPPAAAPVSAAPDVFGIPIKVGAGLRAGLRMQDPDKPKNMSEVHLDSPGYGNAVELRFSGDVTENFGFTANFNAVLDGGAGLAPAAAVGIMDLIAKYHASDEFNIWAGRLLVPSDRSNFTGPFFMSPWNYPGFYFRGAGPLGPKDWANGRDVGTTVWGNALDAKLKYYAGVYGLDQGLPNSSQPAGANPYYSARVSYTFQGAEPGYFGSSTYYGGKQVFTVGAGAQYQKNGSAQTSDGIANGGTADTFLFMVDALAEENITGFGTLDLEGQFYKFNGGYNFGGATAPAGNPIFAPDEAFYLLVSYLTPTNVGIGKIQPLVRWQQTINPGWTIVDAALAYVIKDYFARVVLTYEHIDTGSDGGVANSMQLGIQVQK